MKKRKTAALLLSALLMLAGCGSPEGGNADESPDEPATDAEAAVTVGPAVSVSGEELNIENTVDAVITLESGEEINVELYPDIAPKSVENFIKLANDGTYEGTVFHRVIKDFMIQGGGYDEDWQERPAESIKGEFTSNGFENDLSHTPGVLSMARTQEPDSASSQFFIVHASSTYLDGNYAAFGKVKDDESMAVVDRIANVETHTVQVPGIPYPMECVPVEPVVIKSVTIVVDDEAE